MAGSCGGWPARCSAIRPPCHWADQGRAPARAACGHPPGLAAALPASPRRSCRRSGRGWRHRCPGRAFSPRSRPRYWRCTPTDPVPCFKNPVSSQISTPRGSPSRAATKERRSSRMPSASQTVVRSSRCIACGSPCPACSASHQQFFRSAGDNSPSTNSRAVRRGSARPNPPATSHISSSNISRQPTGSNLWPAATATSSGVNTTPHDHAVAAPCTPDTSKITK